MTKKNEKNNLFNKIIMNIKSMNRLPLFYQKRGSTNEKVAKETSFTT